MAIYESEQTQGLRGAMVGAAPVYDVHGANGRDIPDVPAAVCRLSESIARNEKVTNELAQRLNAAGVLQFNGASVAKPGDPPPTPGRCDLARAIYERAEMLDRTTSVLAEALTRLQV